MNMEVFPFSNVFLKLFTDLNFFIAEVFHLMVRFIPIYFIAFDAPVSGIVSIIFLLACLLVVYRKATYFCKLVIYSGTLLKLLLVFCLNFGFSYV